MMIAGGVGQLARQGRLLWGRGIRRDFCSDNLWRLRSGFGMGASVCGAISLYEDAHSPRLFWPPGRTLGKQIPQAMPSHLQAIWWVDGLSLPKPWLAALRPPRSS